MLFDGLQRTQVNQEYRTYAELYRAQAEAIWCLVAHTRPANVVETGVAHGLTSRVILEGLSRHGGHEAALAALDAEIPGLDLALARI